ncbi:uncharacterized protein LOC141902029 [Tubulanus polymorphus]|uniref:uncharacterized protein LOC141902029 n=1 Tax=Tubulanus polymorphus TaxID=672921 RepID=UPI003DA366BA
MESSTNSNLSDSVDYKVKRTPTITSTIVGTTRTVEAIKPKEWSFLALTCLNLFLTVALTIERLVVLIIYEKKPTSQDFTFAILLLLNIGFCGFYAIHGVLRERVFEVYALIAAILTVELYCIIEYIENVDGRNTIKLVRLIVICVLAPLNIFLAVIAAKGFGFLDCRIVGATQFMQSIYRTLTIYSCFLKFDLQVALSIVVLVMVNGTNVELFEIITLSVGIPYSIIWTTLGIIFVQKENKFGMIFLAILSLPAPAYVIYKLIYVYSRIDTMKPLENEVILYSQFFASALFLIVRFLLAFEGISVYKNFGKGLKEIDIPDEPNERSGLLSGRSHTN